MAVKKIEELNIHRDVNSTEQFDVQDYLNENWDKMQDVVDNNAEELMQAQKDISTLKEDNKTNKSSIDVLEKSNETRDGKISKNTENIEAIQGSIKTAIETINKKDNEQDGKITLNKESIKEIQSENERLREDIKSIATIGEASGENIHLEDSSNARCELEIGGNHQQDTREGYNFLDLSNFSTQTKNGVTATKNEDGSIKLVGTNSGDTFNINLSTINGEIGDYIVSGVTGGSRETYFLAIVQTGVKTFAEVTNGSSNFSLTEETTIAANIYIVKGATINTTIYPMMIKGTENKPYEQYGASPSLDFPSELKAVGDDINILNDTIFARKGYYNGTAGATIKKVNSTTRLLTDEDISVISNKDIAISLGTDKALMYNVFEIDENDVIIKNNMSSNNKDKTIKLQENTKKISLMLMWQDTSKTITLEDIKDCKIKITYGTSIKNYSSYNCGSAKIDIFNENIFPNLSNKSVSDRGITLSYDGNTKEFCAKGITTAKEFYCNISFKELKYLNANKSYIFSIDNPILQNLQMQLTKYGVLANAQIDTQKKSANITQLDKAKPNSILLYSNNIAIGTKIDWTFKVQIKEGTIATNYVQHEEQSYLVDVQQEMLEGDTFVRQDGKWYEKHCWKKMLLNGTEKVGVSGASTNEILAIVYDINNAVDGFGYSNYFLYSSQVELNKMSVYNGGKNLRVNVSKMQFADSEPFKAKLKELYEAGTPVIIYYKLAEPILLECTKAQSKVLDEIYNKAHTYKNITNILVESAEVNPIINVKYLKDTETEHNKLQTQIDEIKQLLSTTETSAMLLNNMQTDLESEV